MILSIFLSGIISCSPYCIEDVEEDKDIVGRWKLVSFIMNGNPVEDDDLGRRFVEFYEDGTVKSYEEDTLDDEGKYEIKGDKLIWTSKEEDTPTTFKFSRSDKELRLIQKISDEQELTIVFKYVRDIEPD